MHALVVVLHVFCVYSVECFCFYILRLFDRFPAFAVFNRLKQAAIWREGDLGSCYIFCSVFLCACLLFVCFPFIAIDLKCVL